MKVKIKSKISEIKFIKEPKLIDKNGYPIKRSEICFQCNKEFLLTFVSLKNYYARRNFWFYWTEKEGDQDKFICSPCLKNISISTNLSERKFYLTNIKSISKKRILSAYRCSNSI